jgi:hypothetical protein
MYAQMLAIRLFEAEVNGTLYPGAAEFLRDVIEAISNPRKWLG